MVHDPRVVPSQNGHLWVPIPMVSGSPFAHTNMDRGGVQAFQLPYTVPQYNVSEVLLYIKLFTNEAPENVDDIRIFTQIKGVEYSKYLYLYLSSLNSDNIWLPLGEDRSVYVELEAYHSQSDAMYMYAIGYR